MRGSVARRGELDEARVANLPPAEINKAGVKAAMIDLQILWEQVKERGGAAPIRAQRAANVIMMGLTYCNSFAGRPGEWETLRRDDVEQFISAGKTALIMEKHKSTRRHGKLGRHVPPGNVVAMRKCLDIHPPNSVLFFNTAAAGGRGAKVRADDLLRKYGKTYTPNHEHPGPTLSRKFFSTEADDNNDLAKAKAMVAECNAHLGSTAESWYVVPKAERVAARSAATFRIYKGEPAPWPSSEEVESKRKESEQRLLRAFRSPFGARAIARGRRAASGGAFGAAKNSRKGPGKSEDPERDTRPETGEAESSMAKKRPRQEAGASHVNKRRTKGAPGPLPSLFAKQWAGMRARPGPSPA